MRLKPWIFFISIILFLPMVGQGTQVVVDVSEEEFSNARDVLEYDKTKRRLRLKRKYWPKPPEEQESLDLDLSGGAVILRMVAYMMIAILVVLLLYLLFSHYKVEKKLDPLDDIEEEIEDIEEIDAEHEFTLALNAGNYKKALRMRFIRSLQILSEKEYIYWEKEKTNRDYYYEIDKANIRTTFRSLANIYERCWYSEQVVDFESFKGFDKEFLSFFNLMN